MLAGAARPGPCPGAHAGRRRGGRGDGGLHGRGRRLRARSGCSSGAPSGRSRRSSTTAPTCWWRPSWRPRPCGTPPVPRPTRSTSSTSTAAMAAHLAFAPAVHNAQMNIQVHGGIGFTWEHDAHLFLRRALALNAVLGSPDDAEDVTARGGTGDDARRDASTCHPRPRRSGPRSAPRRRASARCPGRRSSARRWSTPGLLVPHWPAALGSRRRRGGADRHRRGAPGGGRARCRASASRAGTS